MADSSDANLLLKKRARRRLVGAIAFAGLAAVVLPMVMDEEPKQQVQDVQIRIPSQDQSPLAAKPGKAPAVSASVEKPAAPESAASEAAAPASPPAAVSRTPDKAPEKKSSDKPEKTAETPAKTSETPAKATVSEPQRAAAILGGKTVAAAPVAANGGDGQYLILIGAFSNPANVKQLQTKIGELGIKVYTEPLDTPEGKKTRVRAGPFPNREAADKALDKMKRIGVNGLVAAKQ